MTRPNGIIMPILLKMEGLRAEPRLATTRHGKNKRFDNRDRYFNAACESSGSFFGYIAHKIPAILIMTILRRASKVVTMMFFIVELPILPSFF